jgi:hypothetical protein
MNEFRCGGRGDARSPISSVPDPLGDLDPNCELYGSHIGDRSGRDFLPAWSYNLLVMDEPQRTKDLFILSCGAVHLENALPFLLAHHLDKSSAAWESY